MVVINIKLLKLYRLFKCHSKSPPLYIRRKK
nr:MAG TPA: hypothetical protein [Caudoviricetes sp.]